MPSADQIAQELSGGINNLFNAAEFLDTSNEVMRQGHGNILGQLIQNGQSATSDAEALGSTVDTNAETTDAVVNDTATTTQDDIASARQALEAAQAELMSEIPEIAAAAVDRVAAAEDHLSNVIINSVDGLAAIQAETMSKIARFQSNPSRYTGGFAEGGRIGANEYGMVGEAGPEFISGPATVMSANTSMGVMQNLMKGIKSLDSSVQNNGINGQNTISNNNVAEQMSNLMSSKFDTMIQQLQALVTIESSSASAQQKTFRATKSLQGNMLKGTI